MKRTELRRTKAIARRNDRRKAREFARCYGSRERVRALQAMPCAGCGHEPRIVPNDNAHTVGGGASRKADWPTVVPLCRPCHREWHRLGSSEAFLREWGVDLIRAARETAERVGADGSSLAVEP